MKKILLNTIFIAAILAFVSIANANTISLSDPSARYLNGGPFTANVIETNPDGLVGSPITGGIQFTSFCLERTEYFYAWNTPYSYTIAEYAVGGAGGAVNGMDYLDPKSAYLYYQFRMNPSAYDTKALQAAFWHIEDELSLPTSPTSGSVEALALSYVSAAATANWTDIGPVVVLNLYDTVHGQLQSQIALRAVPEPTTLLLLGFGLIGLAGAGKKFKK